VVLGGTPVLVDTGSAPIHQTATKRSIRVVIL
jgi:hypothetical protein